MTDSQDDDTCPLVGLGLYDSFTEEIRYCPFCGADATPNNDTGTGYATCTACDDGFWVEL